MHESLKLVYRIVNRQINTDTVLTINADVHPHHTRQRHNARIRANTNSVARRRLTHQYNILPQEIKEAASCNYVCV